MSRALPWFDRRLTARMDGSVADSSTGPSEAALSHGQTNATARVVRPGANALRVLMDVGAMPLYCWRSWYDTSAVMSVASICLLTLSAVSSSLAPRMSERT